MYNGLRPYEIAAIKDKRWQLDFATGKLIRNDGTLSIEGPGYIRMEPDGRIVFKLYWRDPLDVAQRFKLFGEHFVKLIPIEKCYTLTATDSYERTWEASNILPDMLVSTQDEPTISGEIHGPLMGLSQSPYESYHAQFAFRCFEKYEFPFNSATNEYHDENGKPMKIGSSLDTAKFSINELEFLLTNRDDQFVMAVTSKNPSIPNLVETRAIESLQFLLGRAIDWHTFEKHEKGKEYIKVQAIHAPTGTIRPPLRYRGPREADYWNLYTKYFQYISQNTNEATWHPISIFIHRILDAREASIETQCLALTVVVEGLLRTECGDLAKLPDDSLIGIEQAKGILHESKIPAHIVKRIADVIDGMKKARVSDQLQELLGRGIITKKEKDTWTKLRNSSAHPEHPFFQDFEETVEAFDRVLTLFYKLVFHRIGYCGKYTDYGTKDMHDDVFPGKPGPQVLEAG